MGCPTECILGDNLVFSITTHDPDTGVLTAADAAPTWRIYEDETAGAILNGTMATLDAGNTTGLYTELVTCDTGSGFENAKTYTVYIEATVDGDTGGICYAFKVINDDFSATEKTSINDEVVDALATDTYAEPGQGAPGATASLSTKVSYLYKFLINLVTNDGTDIEVYNDAGDTVDHKSPVSEAAGKVTRGKFISGP